jgi:YidC/Oxa1 family membrane protein insertase
VGEIFSIILINPLTNAFVFLTHLLFDNAGLGVVALTVLIRIVTYPLTVRQLKMTRGMAIIAPRLQEIQKRYKDPRRRSQEQMKLYRAAGISPLGCLTSTFLQLPIFIALFSVFRLSFASSPEALIELSERLYPSDFIRGAVPLNESFLWLNLAAPDPIVIPLLTAITTYALQKVSTLPARDEKQAAQNQMMIIMMPLVFAFITTTLPSGIGLYYVLSNVMGFVIQYVYVGGGPINWRGLLNMNRDAVFPRAVEVRQGQIDALLAHASGDDDDDTPGERNGRKARASAEGDAEAASDGAAARRRRRYSNGRRRGRR